MGAFLGAVGFICLVLSVFAGFTAFVGGTDIQLILAGVFLIASVIGLGCMAIIDRLEKLHAAERGEKPKTIEELGG